jgi:hypothetical protein
MAPTDDLRAAAAAKGSPIPAEWGALVPRGGMSRTQVVCGCVQSSTVVNTTSQSCNLFFKIFEILKIGVCSLVLVDQHVRGECEYEYDSW